MLRGVHCAAVVSQRPAPAAICDFDIGRDARCVESVVRNSITHLGHLSDSLDDGRHRTKMDTLLHLLPPMRHVASVHCLPPCRSWLSSYFSSTMLLLNSFNASDQRPVSVSAILQVLAVVLL
jgi:hypothetical protein